MSITLADALGDSLTLDADNPAHVADVQNVIARSTLRTGVTLAIVDGTYTTAPATHSAAAKVMLDTLDVEFSHSLGVHTAWRRTQH